MLVLTRKVGQVILIDGGIKIHVQSISGTQVKIGIEAPQDVGIVREEISHRTEGKNYA